MIILFQSLWVDAGGWEWDWKSEGKERTVLWGFLRKEGEKKSLLRDWLESKPGSCLLISHTVYYDKAFNILEERTAKEVVWLTGWPPLLGIFLRVHLPAYSSLSLSPFSPSYISCSFLQQIFLSTWYLLIQPIFIECILCATRGCRCWRHSSEVSRQALIVSDLVAEEVVW